ncbi:hypothetical protein A9K55_006084 [Cordyceps militaris]|uniref:Uncharacterized protein n=1 Tax=Cordyceps militaris TaxID=73501 RepID=A0A2H4SDY8_CORMI|nr:hypothetical protein A9K55_006084 [Cordyceps militaris]
MSQARGDNTYTKSWQRTRSEGRQNVCRDNIDLARRVIGSTHWPCHTTPPPARQGASCYWFFVLSKLLCRLFPRSSKRSPDRSIIPGVIKDTPTVLTTPVYTGSAPPIPLIKARWHTAGRPM